MDRKSPFSASAERTNNAGLAHSRNAWLNRLDVCLHLAHRHTLEEVMKYFCFVCWSLLGAGLIFGIAALIAFLSWDANLLMSPGLGRFMFLGGLIFGGFCLLADSR
jgi:hypothetical protein